MAREHPRVILAGLAALALVAGSLDAADWPTYQGDAERSGVTAGQLELPLAPRWSYQTSQPPMPAWPEPGKELHRMDFDYAFQPVVAGGLVYFGSSADDTVRALNAETGELVWRFTAGAPVRFAPTIARGKAYVASDDGRLYCLDAKTGELRWQFEGAPDDDRILGNGRMISRWPCRTGAVVVDDVVYFTAGMWPTEGVFVYALDAETGKELWSNDSSGEIYVDLPHPGAMGFSGVAPQGYLVVHGDTLLVPTGRCVPAAFDRHTGRLLYYKPADALYHGGAWITAAGDWYFNAKNRFQNPSESHVGEAEPSSGDGTFAYRFASGEVELTLGDKYRVLASGDVLYAVGSGNVQAIDLKAVRRNKRVATKDVKWSTPHASRVYCLAKAGDVLLAGNRGSITAIDAADGKPIWSGDVDGQVRGLAIADGRLVASTDHGLLVSFEHGQAADVACKQITEAVDPPSVSAEHQAAAQKIVARSGKRDGYALVIGEPDSRLAEAIARQTELRVVGVLSSPLKRGATAGLSSSAAQARTEITAGQASSGTRASNVDAERERLLATGLYGGRVWVEAVEDLAHLPYGPYFADLVVVSGEVQGVCAEECYRMLRPCGGVLSLVGFDEAEQRTFVADAGAAETELSDAGPMIVRGTLPGSGEWRYPWADGGRTGIGSESRVKLPLGLLWFGGPGPDRLMDRHWMGSPPIATGGRTFLAGQHHVIAFDAYNGRELWSRPLPGVGRKYAQYYSSNLVADDRSVYVVRGEQCHALDQATGGTRLVYDVPASVIKGTPPPVVPEHVDVEWPDVWQVIGPFPKGKPPLSRASLETIPERVTVAGKEYAAASLAAAGGVLDFSNLYGGYGLKPLAEGEKPGVYPRKGAKRDLAESGRIAYALARIDCPRPGKLLLGAGADWWMQWYLDGEPVFDTLDGGNEPSRHNLFSPKPCSAEDYLFDVDVTAGEHVLAVMVKSGAAGWGLASASMAGEAKRLMPVMTGRDPNLPDLASMIWGYVSVADDLVLGTYNVPITQGQPAESHLIWRSECKALFALEKQDGSVRWVYRPRADRTVSNIEIALGDGRLFLIDGTSKVDSTRAKRRGETIDAKLTLVALDLNTGGELWRQDDVPLLPDRSQPTRLKSNPSHLFMGQPSWGHLVYSDGVVVLGANAAYDAATGKKLWAKSARPQKLPIVHGGWLIAHPLAYDLRTGGERTTEDILTGQQVPWRYGREYGCGPVNGCQGLLFFRSGADGFFDMSVEGTTNFGGVRPSCARSLLAAGGLVIHPEGYSGCCCSYNYQTSLALVPTSERDDAWYVLPRRASTGPIRRIAVNFGAPGDRRDPRGVAWLGFPRPMTAGACPAPVTIRMENASCQHRRRATGAIRGTDSPWLYASGLQGAGRIAVDLVLQPDLVVPTREDPPTIDGKLDDPCWEKARAVPFENTPFSLLGAAVDLRIFRDAENLYFGYHRKPISNPAKDVDEATQRASDALEIYVTDRKGRAGIRCGLKRNGDAFARCGTVDRYRKVDPTWQGRWQYALDSTAEQWTAEIAVPLATLTESGIDVGRLQLNGMSQNLTGSGLESIFLVDPRYGADFRRCVQFRRVADPPSAKPKERRFTVRLHFAEIDDVEAGRRVFDVAIQGRTVLEDLDVAGEAGARNVALVKEFRGIAAGDRMTLELVPKATGTGQTETVPVICALEIVEEE